MTIRRFSRPLGAILMAFTLVLLGTGPVSAGSKTAAPAMQGQVALAGPDDEEPPANLSPSDLDGIEPADLDGPHHWMWTDEEVPWFEDHGGRIDFWTVGDHMLLCDKRADGRSAEALVWSWDRSDHRWDARYHLKAAGKGVCDAAHGRQGGQRDLPEDRCISVAVYLTNNGAYVSGSQDEAFWQNDNTHGYNCNQG